MYQFNYIRKYKLTNLCSSAVSFFSFGLQLKEAQEKTVVTWGKISAGADSSSVESDLKNIKKIYSSNSAFSALTYDGSVITWGNGNLSGDSSSVQSHLKNIKEIYSTDGAFAK